MVFFDTNVFVYAFLATEARKRETAINLVETSLRTGQGCVSYQVIQEFVNVARKKFAVRMTADDCKAFIDAALQAGAHTLYSEDLQHWQLVRGLLRIVNPFQEVTHEN